MKWMAVDYHFVSHKNFKNLLRKQNFMNMQKYLATIMEHQKKMLMKLFKK